MLDHMADALPPLQAVWQTLRGTRELLAGVAEGPEHGRGVSAQGRGITVWERGADLHAPAARRGHDAVETQVHGHLAVDVPGVTDHEVHQAHP